MVRGRRLDRSPFPGFASAFLLAVLAAVLPVTGVHAGTVSLGWEANPESDVTGYRIYYGQQSRAYHYNVDAGNNTGITITGLEDGKTYFFTATAYDASGNESQFSDEVSFVSVQDGDGDGLADAIEVAAGTNPNDADTDDDGIPDGVEDANGNGIVDPGETNPRRADSDGDGLKDGTELGYTLADAGPGTNPAFFRPDLDPTTTTDPLNADMDGDWLTDAEEDVNRNGRVDAGESDPNLAGASPMFTEDFSDGKASGDPDWAAAQGIWGVTAGKQYFSSPRYLDTAVVVDPAMKPLAAGRVSTWLKCDAKSSSPNAGILFSFRGTGAYRYAKVYRGTLYIGQVGAMGGDTQGTKASRAVGLAAGKWHHLRVDFDAAGRVKVFVNFSQKPALVYAFKAPVGGKVGLQASRTSSLFDRFAAWGGSVLSN